MLYFIQSEDGPIKIGQSSDPRLRLAQLQSACPRRLQIIGVVGERGYLERSLHARFRHLATSGGAEWFEGTKEITDAMEDEMRQHLPADLYRAWLANPAEGIEAIIEYYAGQETESVQNYIRGRWGVQLHIWTDRRPFWLRCADGDKGSLYPIDDDPEPR